MKRSLFFILTVFLVLVTGLSSCYKEKLMKRPSSNGIGQTKVIEMGPRYTDQFFYNLSTNTVISQNSRLAYDLMFDCADNDYHIWLNTAKFMSVVRTGKTEMSEVSILDTLGKNFRYELGAFNPDSSAIGQWWETPADPTQNLPPASKGEVYIINLGVDIDGNPLGFVKVQFSNFARLDSFPVGVIRSYGLVYSDINKDERNIVAIVKDPTRNYKYLSFNNGAHTEESIEPPKEMWDLCFTQYSTVFYEPYYLPYMVTGVLTNPSHVSAYLDSTLVFENIDIGNFQAGRLETRRDAIGYEWKRYTGIYNTKTHYTYYIQAADNRIYKLRFINFLQTGSGSNGYPSFEYKEL